MTTLRELTFVKFFERVVKLHPDAPRPFAITAM